MQLMTLRQLRQHRGLSQTQLADLLGKSQAQVSKWETGVRNPSWRSQRLIANTLYADWLEDENEKIQYTPREPEHDGGNAVGKRWNVYSKGAGFFISPE